MNVVLSPNDIQNSKYQFYPLEYNYLLNFLKVIVTFKSFL